MWPGGESPRGNLCHFDHYAALLRGNCGDLVGCGLEGDWRSWLRVGLARKATWFHIRIFTSWIGQNVGVWMLTIVIFTFTDGPLCTKCQEISGKLLPCSPLAGCFHFDLVLLGATFEISKHLWRSSQSDLPRPTKELMQKGYGIGSGISLFIATNICERRLDRYLRKMKRWPWKWTTGSKDSEPYRQVHYGQCWDSHFLCGFVSSQPFWKTLSDFSTAFMACPPKPAQLAADYWMNHAIYCIII